MKLPFAWMVPAGPTAGNGGRTRCGHGNPGMSHRDFGLSRGRLGNRPDPKCAGPAWLRDGCKHVTPMGTTRTGVHQAWRNALAHAPCALPHRVVSFPSHGVPNLGQNKADYVPEPRIPRIRGASVVRGIRALRGVVSVQCADPWGKIIRDDSSRSGSGRLLHALEITAAVRVAAPCRAAGWRTRRSGSRRPSRTARPRTRPRAPSSTG